VPHPGIAERRFVLEPLAEAMPDAVVPFLGLVDALLERPDVQSQDVRRVERAAVSIPGPQ
jgi:7,8-dihydro-6-hydroxymethylpterin-pyrophosphokinase